MSAARSETSTAADRSAPGADHDGDVERLLDFLRDRSVACPQCGYDLRALTRPVCPECRHDLVLTVGVRDVQFGWFLATVTPGLFSGIAALLLLIPMIMTPLTGGGSAPWPIWVVDGFGWLSGLAAMLLIVRRRAFLRQRRGRQRAWAGIAWGVHLGMFLWLLGKILGGW